MVPEGAGNAGPHMINPMTRKLMLANRRRRASEPASRAAGTAAAPAGAKRRRPAGKAAKADKADKLTSPRRRSRPSCARRAAARARCGTSTSIAIHSRGPAGPPGASASTR